MKTPIRYTGPYTFLSGKCKDRKFMSVYYSDGSKGTTLYSRYLMQKHLGRELGRSEQVDHINEDKTDDRIENLQLLTPKQNTSKAAKAKWGVTTVKFICPGCGKEAESSGNQVRRNRKQGKRGPYCSKACAARDTYKNPWEGRAGYTEAVCGTRTKYRYGCRCDKCRAANTEEARKLRNKKCGSDGGLVQPAVLGTAERKFTEGSNPSAPTKL
jgi:hypothetical protein